MGKRDTKKGTTKERQNTEKRIKERKKTERRKKQRHKDRDRQKETKNRKKEENKLSLTSVPMFSVNEHLCANHYNSCRDRQINRRRKGQVSHSS